MTDKTPTTYAAGAYTAAQATPIAGCHDGYDGGMSLSRHP